MKLTYLKLILTILLSFGGGIVTFAQLTAACSPTYTGMDLSHYISSFSAGTLTHTPTYNVHDYTAQSFTVDAGSINSLTVISKGWCGVATAADFNNDGDFDDPGELFPNPTYIDGQTATYTFDITIPASITSGSYRFRVFNYGANSTDGVPVGSACGAYEYGSWADYTMNVVNTSGCQPPTGLTVTNVLSTTADLSWTASATTPLGYIWKIVPQGDDPDLVAGINGTTTTTTASAAGLTSLTAYQLYVKSDCGTDSSVWSMSALINTTCAGTPSAGVAASGAASICAGIDFTLDLTGAASGTGITYQWQSASTGQNIWTDIASATTASFTISQSSETDYRAIVTCVGSGLHDTSNVVSIGMNPGNACYCIPTGASNNTDEIVNFTVGSINNTSAPSTGTSGYMDYSTTIAPADLFIGSSYIASLEAGSGSGSHGAAVWIDYNDNGIFESSERVTDIGSSIAANAVVSFPAFTVPNSPGTHRLRVQYRFNISGSSLDPCVASLYAETEDYSVTVSIPTGCITPAGLVASHFTNDAADIKWSPSALGDPFANFNYEIRTTGAAGSGASGLATSGTAIVDTFAALTGLTAGTTYTAYVRTNCTGTTQSNWTSGVTFTLPTYVPVAVTGFNADVIANGVGAASSSTTNDVDGVSFGLVAQDFKASATGPSPTKFLPNGGSITSGTKWFQLANYTGDNSLRLSGASQSGKLAFLAPKKATTLYVMGISGSAASSVNAVVWFSDNTSQSFTNLAYPDWFATTGNIVVSQIGRIGISTNGLEAGAGPQLFENTLAISAANQSKQIDSIVFTTGATSTGVMNVLALSIIPNYTQSCAMPSSVTSSNITAQSADIAWTGNGTSTDYQISYGAAGTLAANGTLVTVPGATTHTINGLSSNTSYQVFVRSVCTGNTYSDWVGPVNFQTLQVACTGTPSAGTLASAVTLACPNTPEFSITNTGATADLDITYEWFSSPAGLNTWTTLASTGNSYLVANQMQATDYLFVVTCTNSGLSDSAVISIGQKPNNECYCIAASSNASYNIDSFSTTGGFQNITNNGSGYSANGYGDFTDSIVSQLLNGVVDFTANYGGGNNTFGTKIWVDWNQDGDFDDLDETVFTSTGYLSTQTGSFTVPATATIGATRMRIGISYTPQSGPADPCSTSNNGEYEDYTFTVLAPCTDPIVDLGNDTAICEGTSLTLDAGNPGLAFEWNDASTSQELTVDTAGTYSVTVTDGICATTDTIIVTVNPLPIGTGISISDNGNGSFDFGVNGASGVQDYVWDFGDEVTGTGATVSHPYMQSGTYTVKVIISNDCGADTLTTSVDAFVVGIANIDPAGNLLTLYPNPAKDNVLIESKKEMNMEELTVFNVLGQVVFEDKKVNSNKYQLNVSKLSSGIYTVRINTNKGMVIRKFEILK